MESIAPTIEANIEYPIKLKTNAKFLEEFYHCEYGRYEDAMEARVRGTQEDIDANNYQCVCCDFLGRWKTQIEVRDDAELCELYYGLASGTIGLYACPHANTLLNIIHPFVEQVNPTVVAQWPRQDCF